MGRAHQPFLLPPSPDEWMREGHLAYFLLDLVAELDFGGIEVPIQARDDPRMTVTLLLYAYCVGLSSRQPVRPCLGRVGCGRAVRPSSGTGTGTGTGKGIFYGMTVIWDRASSPIYRSYFCFQSLNTRST